MEKILATLYILSVSEAYDVWLPTFLPIEELLPLVTDLVKECAPFNYIPPKQPMLCCKEREILMDDPKMTLSDYGIMNGDTLYLF